MFVLTCVTGVVLYVFTTYAIWCNSAAWVEVLLQNKIRIANGEREHAGKRHLASFTQLTLPVGLPYEDLLKWNFDANASEADVRFLGFKLKKFA